MNVVICENRRITTREIHSKLPICQRAMHHIFHRKFSYGKFCVQWIPKHLSEKQAWERMSIYLILQLRYAEKEKDFVKIVAYDEAW